MVRPSQAYVLSERHPETQRAANTAPFAYRHRRRSFEKHVVYPLPNSTMITRRKNFRLYDICDFVKMGVQAIVDDEVTKRFDTEGK